MQLTRQKECFDIIEGNATEYDAANLQEMKKELLANPVDRRLKILMAKHRNGNTIVHAAASQGRSEVISEMVGCIEEDKRYELISQRNDEGRTVLHAAVLSRSVDTVEAIVNVLQPHENLKLSMVQDENGQCPLDCALNINRPEISALLQSSGSNRKTGQQRLVGSCASVSSLQGRVQELERMCERESAAFATKLEQFNQLSKIGEQKDRQIEESRIQNSLLKKRIDETGKQLEALEKVFSEAGASRKSKHTTKNEQNTEAAKQRRLSKNHTDSSISHTE